MTLMGFENLMTLKEVAGLLRVSPQTLYKLLEQGAIPALKIGNQWRFDRDRVNQWLEHGSALSPEEVYESRSA